MLSGFFQWNQFYGADICPAPNQKARRGCRRAFGNGGAKRDRTADLYNAIVALSQLSYGPETLGSGGTIWRSPAALETALARKSDRRHGPAIDGGKPM